MVCAGDGTYGSRSRSIHLAETVMTAPPRTSSDHRLPELDGIRAIAILMVLFAHAFLGFPNAPGALAEIPSPVMQIIGHGWLGVDLFFILSGFLITGILVETKSRPHYFRNFYIRRALRIMPLYFVVIAVWSLFYTDGGRYFLLSSVFAANLSEILGIHEPHGPGVLWSLAVEEHFYLIWPLVVLLLSRRRLFTMSAAIFIAMPVLRAIFAARGMHADTIYVLSWFRFDGLATGAMIALWSKSPYCSRRSAFIVALSAFAIVTVMTIVGLPYGIMTGHTVASIALRYTQTYLVFGGLFVLAYALRETVWTAPLRWSVLQLTGALSYCLYLVHLSIGDAFEYLAKNQFADVVAPLGPTAHVMLRTAVMVLISFAIALISRRVLEEPFLSLKDRLTGRQRPAGATLPDAGAREIAG